MYKSLISRGLIIYDADMDESAVCLGKMNKESYGHFAWENAPSVYSRA